MRRGKEIAQGAHASLGAILSLMSSPIFSEDQRVRILAYEPNSALAAWLEGRFTKVTLVVNSEEELITLTEKAKEAGLVHCLVTDAGLTEFHGVPTKTVLAIGPAWPEDIDKITGELKLY